MLNDNAPASTPETPRPMRDCFVVIKGTAPRCRKVDTHIEKIGLHPVDVDPETMLSVARDILARFKNVQRAKLCLHYTEIKRSTDGVEWKTTALFDARHVEIPLV
jgi:hypothetical protein